LNSLLQSAATSSAASPLPGLEEKKSQSRPPRHRLNRANRVAGSGRCGAHHRCRVYSHLDFHRDARPQAPPSHQPERATLKGSLAEVRLPGLLAEDALWLRPQRYLSFLSASLVTTIPPSAPICRQSPQAPAHKRHADTASVTSSSSSQRLSRAHDISSRIGHQIGAAYPRRRRIDPEHVASTIFPAGSRTRC